MPQSCAWVSAYPACIPCVALAVGDGQYCAVHRDQELYSRVPKPKGKAVPVLCAICQGEIKVGALQKRTPAGPVHAEYTCYPPTVLTTELTEGDARDQTPPV